MYEIGNLISAPVRVLSKMWWTNLITGLYQILETAKNRESSSDGALPVNEASRLGVARRLDLLVELEARGETLLVRGDQVDVHPEDSRVERGQGIGSGRVDEDGRSCERPGFKRFSTRSRRS